MDDIQISVVIPTFNRAEVITRAIDSALDQRSPPSEIILIDDGSTDGTLDQVRPYRDRIKVESQLNRGATIARNVGVTNAKCEWIAFLDSDDYWLPGYLERMREAIRSTSGAASFYFTDTIRPASEGGRQLWELISFSISGDYEFATDASNWVMMRPQPMMLQSSVINRLDYLGAGGLWDQLPLRHDSHLFLRLGLNGTACAVAGIGALMTSDSGGTQRLTSKYGAASRGGYQQQVLMFEDILRKVAGLTSVDKVEMRRRLADAHRGLARIEWRKNQPLKAIMHAGKSALINPVSFFRHLCNYMVSPKMRQSTG